MKNSLKLSMLLVALCVTQAVAQNKLPVLQNVKAVVDTVQKQIAISYDVADADDETVAISVQMSNQNGALTSLVDGQGDIGFQAVGKGKKITGRYTDAALIRQPFAIRIIANDRQKASIGEMVALVDSNRIKQNTALVFGMRDHETKKGIQHLAEVKTAVADQFKASRLVTAVTPFTWKQFSGQNVVGIKENIGDQPKTFVVGAHMDAAKGSPGGDDNATGVAGMLEVMRTLSAFEFRHRIVFVGFDCEEIGFLGSQFFVRTYIERKEPIAGMINFDMLGAYSDQPKTQLIPEGFDALFPDVAQMVAQNEYRGNFLVCTANQSSEELGKAFREIAGRHVPSLKIAGLVALENGDMTPTLAASDHASFWKGGIQAIHLGDGGETRNPRLNTPKDDLTGMNYTFAGQTVKATVAAIAELAQIQHAAVAVAAVSFAGNSGATN